MKYTLERLSEEHREPVVDIFNYYIENTYAAYPEQCVSYAFYDFFFKAAAGYPAWAVRAEDGRVVGFGLLRPYRPLPTFSHTAEITYFLRPDACGQGIGTDLLNRLLEEAETQGIRVVLASISALNEGSLRFHCRHGFDECGRFKGICRKNGRDFDIVWMQKTLPSTAR